MSIEAWYVTLFALGSGIAIQAYWLTALVFGALPIPRMDLPGARAHVVAEMITGDALIAAGLARLATDADWVLPLTGIALGALVYALIQSPGFYPHQRPIRAALYGARLAAAPALVLVLTQQA